jgi:protein TonB
VKTAGGGIRDFSLLLLASLLLHLVVFTVANGSYRRQLAALRPSQAIMVDYLSSVADRQPPKDSGPNPEHARPQSPIGNPHPATASVRGSAALLPLKFAPTAGEQLPKPTAAAPAPVSVKSAAAADASRGMAAIAGAAPISAAQPGNKETHVRAPGKTAAAAGSGGSSPAGAGSREFGGPGATRGNGAAGAGTVSPQRRVAYQDMLKRLVEEHKDYPFAARRSRQQGSCQRRFVLSRNGSIKQVEELSSCGHSLLDEAATRAITTVGSFPPLPEEVKGAEEAFTVTIKFALR